VKTAILTNHGQLCRWSPYATCFIEYHRVMEQWKEQH